MTARSHHHPTALSDGSLTALRRLSDGSPTAASDSSFWRLSNGSLDGSLAALWRLSLSRTAGSFWGKRIAAVPRTRRNPIHQWEIDAKVR
jgi:hypothetical protein